MKKSEKPDLEVDEYPFAKIRGSMRSPQNRLLVGVPMTGLLRAEWVLARHHQIIPTNWSLTERIVPLPSYSPLNYLVADARNSVVKALVEHNFEWLLFIDHDTIIPPATFLKMGDYIRDGNIPVVSGLYFTKSKPAEPLIYRGRGNSYYADWKLGDKVWVDGLPMGCTLIHGSILRALWNESEEYWYPHQHEMIRRVFETPQNVYFDPQTMNWFNSQGTEDMDFCRRVIEDKIFEKAGWSEFQEKEFPFLIDTGIFCRHIDWDGNQYPIDGEESQFAICNIENCRQQASVYFNHFYWCKKHDPSNKQ